MIRTLRCMFAAHYEELEQKATKRQLKLERELAEGAKK